jgi:hypothetical protein
MFFNNVNEMLMLIHFHSYKVCLCLGEEVMVKGSIVSPFVMAQIMFVFR